MPAAAARRVPTLAALLLFVIGACQAQPTVPSPTAGTPAATAVAGATTPPASPANTPSPATVTPTAGTTAPIEPTPQVSPSASASTGPVASSPGQLDPVTSGPGPFALLKTTVGLADLSSYRATLTVTFAGSAGGQPKSSSTTYVMLAASAPAARQLTIHDEGSDTAPDRYLAEVAGVAYAREGTETCTATVVDPGHRLADAWEPARFLAGVIGADEAGSETLDGIATQRYSFDQRAFGLMPPHTSTGQLWVASDGGYIARYLVTTVGTSDYFGQAVEGTLTWDYQVTDVGRPIVVELPEGCPAGLTGAPVMAAASDIVEVPGLTSFTTASSPGDVATFYRRELPALGWKLQPGPALDKATVILDFSQGTRSLTVIAIAVDGVTTVRLVVGPTDP